MENRKDKMIELVKKGFSYQDIGDVFDISRQRVHQLIKDIPSHNYPRNPLLKTVSLLPKSKYRFRFNILQWHTIGFILKNGKRTKNGGRYLDTLQIKKYLQKHYRAKFKKMVF